MKKIPAEVYELARQISGDPAFLEEILGDWAFFELAAESDRSGQQAPKDSPEYLAALNGLKAFLAWADKDFIKVKQLVTLDWVENGIGNGYSYRKAIFCGIQKFFRIKRTIPTPNDILIYSDVRLICLV